MWGHFKDCSGLVFHPLKHLTSMSRNDFCTYGIGNGKWPSLFLTSRIGNGNEKLNSQLSGLGMKMNNSTSNFWDWDWEWKTVFQTQPGKEFPKEYWEKVVNKNSHYCLPRWYSITSRQNTPIIYSLLNMAGSTPYYSSLFRVMGMGMGITNTIPNSWDWEWEWKTVFPTQLGKNLEQEFPLISGT